MGRSGSGDGAEQRSPFLGLGFYTEADAKWFFGRSTERKIILAHLRTARLTLLYAESGVGKSSLLRAGVAARLRELAEQSIDAGRPPRFVPVVFSAWRDEPVADLIAEIARQVHPLIPGSEAGGGSRSTTAGSGDGLAGAISAAASRLDASLVIILDQFEEHFSYRLASRRPDRLAEELAECVNSPDVRANFLIAVREDAYGRLGDLFGGRISNVYNNYLHLEYMTREAARDAIEKPVEVYNAEHAGEDPIAVDDDLTDAVLEEVQRGRLELGAARSDRENGGSRSASSTDEIETPFLQLVMTRLWECERGQGSRRLRKRTLDGELGGAEAIVRNHVSLALAGLDGEELETATDIFGDLVTPSGAKVAHTAVDLTQMTGHRGATVDSVLGRLYEERIVRAVDPAPGTTDARYEIFHDRLAAPILDWGDQQRTARLERARQRAEAEAGTQRAQARRFKRRARITLGLALTLLIVLVALIVALQYARDQSASASREKREATYFGLTSRAESELSSRPDVSLLLYLAAYSESPQPVAERSLLATLNEVDSSGSVGILHGHIGPVNSIAFSPEGTTLASAGGDKTIRFWAITSAGHYPLGRPLRANEPLYSVAFDPTGRLLASGSFNEILLWTVRRHAEQAVIRDRAGPIASVAFSRQGNMLAAGGLHGPVLLWNTVTHRRTPLPAPSGGTRSVAFSPDGAVLAASSGRAVVLWSTTTDRRLGQLLVGDTGSVYSIAFSPDGRTVAAGGGSGTVDVWSLATRTKRSLFGPTLVNSIAFSPDGRSLAVGSGAVTVWGLAAAHPTPQILNNPLGGVSSVAFSSNGKTLAGAILDGTISLWPLPLGQRFGQALVRRPGGTTRVAVSPNGLIIASGGHTGQIFIVSRTGTPERVLSGDGAPVTALVFDPSGRVLAASYGDGTIRLWDASNGQGIGPPFGADSGWVYSIAFDNTGTRLVSGGADGIVRLWDVRTDAEVGRQMAGNVGQVFAVAFSPDGSEIASGGDGRAIRLWNARTQLPLNPPLIPQNAAVFSLAFSPGGRLLASGGGDDTIELWNVRSRPYRLVHTLTGNLSFVRSVAFSPDGETLASGGSDDMVRLWDVGTGAELGSPLTGNKAPVESVSYSGDGQFLASGGRDNPVRLWQGVTLPSSFADVRALVCRFMGAGLSTREWSEYAPKIPYRRTCPRSTPS